MQLPVANIVGTAPEKGGGWCRSCSTAFIRTTSARILDTEGVRDPHGPSLRHAGDGLLQDPGDGARVDVVLQYARGNRPARRPRLEHTRRRCWAEPMDLKDLYRDVIVDRQPPSARTSASSILSDVHADGHQSVVRRSADGVRQSRGRAHHRHEVRRQRLRDLGRVRFTAAPKP